MNTTDLRNALSGGLGRVKARINNKSLQIGYDLDFENKLVSITESDLVYKDVIVHGHGGASGGRKWKSKSWTPNGKPARVLFTGSAKEALKFLDELGS